MSELSRSSLIRACLLDPTSSESELELDSDINTDIENIPENESNLLDFSSGSGEEYHPNLDEHYKSASSTEVQVSRRNRQLDSNAYQPRPSTSQTAHRPIPISQNPVSDSDSDDDNPNANVPISSNWVRVYPPEPQNDIERQFRVRNPGGRNLPPRNSQPLQYFLLFFTDYLWNMMTVQTNLYANNKVQNKRSSGSLSRHSRLSKWQDIVVNDIKAYIALIINMGLNFKNNYKNYWSTRKSQKFNFFSEVMSLNKYQMIRSNFHLSWF